MVASEGILVAQPPRKRLRGRPSSGVQSPVSGRLYGWYQKVSHWLMNVFSDSRKESIPTPSSASLGASSTGSPSSPHSEALPAGRSTSTALIASEGLSYWCSFGITHCSSPIIVV